MGTQDAGGPSGSRPETLFAAAQEFLRACEDFDRAAASCQRAINVGRNPNALDDRRWPYACIQWRETLQPRLDRALERCRELGPDLPHLKRIETLYDEMLREWEGICEYRNNCMLPTGAPQSNSPVKVRDPGGAPRKYNWDGLADDLMLRLGKEGIPETKAELIKMCQKILAIGDKKPVTKDVREYLQQHFPKLYEASGKNPNQNRPGEGGN
jgi:hypothetical protein